MVANLKLKGSVPESPATLDTFATTYAKIFINGIFKEGVLDKTPFNCAGRTQLIFCARVQGFGVGFEVSAT